MNRFEIDRRTLGERLVKAATVLMAGLVLGSCGGDGYDGPPANDTQLCTVEADKQWLRDYFYGNTYTGQAPWYFWYALGPNPDPSGYADAEAYFKALLYTGSNATFPRDRWSFHQTTESFNRFFGDGQTLGYGLFVAGLEVTGQPTQPLYVRYIEPASPAALVAGLQRGDRIDSVNGRPASELIAADDFTVLTPNSTSDSIVVAYSRGGVARGSVTIPAAIFTLTPVTNAAVVTTPGNRKMGYLVVKDMISQAATPLANAFANFKAQGVTELVLDIRYNGGGLVSVGRDLASYVPTSSSNGRVFASLLYNDQQALKNPSPNQSFLFRPPANALGLTKVYVLAGRRTCSASEQVINGLRGVGVDAVVIGETTCGKPVGFLPADNGCGETYNVVNFESVNAKNEGRYFDGFAATCPVAENFTQALGSSTEPLLNAARLMADGGACPTAGGPSEQPQTFKASPRRGGSDGERPMMIPR